jgi:hypothetical protein
MNLRIWAILALCPLSAEVAVTYQLSSGSGMGDLLLGYLHAKWISYQYGYPLLYKPFKYSDEFALHDLEEPLSEKRVFKEHLLTSDLGILTCPRSRDLLYEVLFFSDLQEDWVLRPEWTVFPIDWKDEGFRRLLKPFLAPRKRTIEKKSSQDGITVALHIRRGGARDMPHSYSTCLWPKRFAPLSYYVAALQKLIEIFPNTPIYVHIFTDHQHPEEIAEELQSHFWERPVFFTHKEANCGVTNVVEDFFELFEFDCLIRSLSNYTLVHSLVGDYKVVIAPISGYWTIRGEQGEYQIDEIDVQIQHKGFL